MYIPFLTLFHYGEKLKPGMEVEHPGKLEWVFQWMFVCKPVRLPHWFTEGPKISTTLLQRRQERPLGMHILYFALCVFVLWEQKVHARCLFLYAYISESRIGEKQGCRNERYWGEEINAVSKMTKTQKLSSNHLLPRRLLTINVHVLYFQSYLLDGPFRMLWQLAKDESHIKSSISPGCNSWRGVGDSRWHETRQTFSCSTTEFQVF